MSTSINSPVNNEDLRDSLLGLLRQLGIRHSAETADHFFLTLPEWAIGRHVLLTLPADALRKYLKRREPLTEQHGGDDRELLCLADLAQQILYTLESEPLPVTRLGLRTANGAPEWFIHRDHGQPFPSAPGGSWTAQPPTAT